MLQIKQGNLLGSLSQPNLTKYHHHSLSVDLNRPSADNLVSNKSNQNYQLGLKPYQINSQSMQFNASSNGFNNTNSNKFKMNSSKNFSANEFIQATKLPHNSESYLMPTKSVSLTPDKMMKTPGLGRTNVGRFDPLVIPSSKIKKFGDHINFKPTLTISNKSNQPIKSLPEGPFNKSIREKNELYISRGSKREEFIEKTNNSTYSQKPLINGKHSELGFKNKSVTHSAEYEFAETPGETMKKAFSEVKLPKLSNNEIEYNDNKKFRNISFDPRNNINNININLSINNVNIINTKNSDGPNQVNSSKQKAKSVDRNEMNKTKSKIELYNGYQQITTSTQSKLFPRKLSREVLQTSSNKTPSIEKQDDLFQSSSRIRTTSGKINKLQMKQIPPFESDIKVVYNFSFKSKAGSLPNKPVKTNQDAYIVYPNFAGQKDKYFFAVCDGHGVNGHLVSNFVKQHLPKNIENQYKMAKSDESISIKDTLTAGFAITTREVLESSIDINFSGTTTVSCLLMGSHLWCANVGDSRAVLAKLKNGEWMPCPVSRDHKPDDSQEMPRILSAGGRIEPFKDMNGDPIGPYRVWLKHENIPGLAMARSIGDGVASSVGVIAIPEIFDFELEEDDKFLIIASDGVWEFLSNQQIINMIAPYYLKNQLEAACDKVIKEATNRWKHEDEVVDDITCIIISLRVQEKLLN